MIIPFGAIVMVYTGFTSKFFNVMSCEDAEGNQDSSQVGPTISLALRPERMPYTNRRDSLIISRNINNQWVVKVRGVSGLVEGGIVSVYVKA